MFPPLPSGYADADVDDGDTSDDGYSSGGDMSSVYGEYSLHKTRNHKRCLSFPRSSRQERGSIETRTKTSYSPPPAIHKLSNHVLFEVFTFYGSNVFSEPGGHRYWWQTLALVCSKWNNAIRSWPSHFLGELRFGNEDSTLFLKNISHRGRNSITHALERSPLSTLNLDYDLIRPSVQNFKGEEDEIVILLQYLERVYSLHLRLSLPTWRSIAAAMSGMPVSCTCIESIYLNTGNRTTGFVLPNSSLKGHAPRLHTLVMIGIFTPSLSSLLLFPTRLTWLILDGIPDTSYLPPRELLMHLSNMPKLQHLSIGFLSATRHRRLPGDVTPIPSPNRVALPCLKKFHFRGVCTYLESLVTNLDAATVYVLVFNFFYQPRYTILHVSAFLRRTKRFGFDGVHISFWPNGIIITATPAISPRPEDVLCFRILCDRLDFQVASAAQICRALGPNFGNMEDLFVNYSQDQLPRGLCRQVHPALWRELLSQFRGMKTLWISSALVLEVTNAMGYDTLQLFKDLPILAWIVVEIHGDDPSTTAARSLSGLLARIRSLGGPVVDVYRLFSDKWKMGRLPEEATVSSG